MDGKEKGKGKGKRRPRKRFGYHNHKEKMSNRVHRLNDMRGRKRGRTGRMEFGTPSVLFILTEFRYFNRSRTESIKEQDIVTFHLK